MRRRILFPVLIALIALPLLSACSGKAEAQAGGMDHSQMKMASLDEMPEEVRAASATTQHAYQFAVANPDVTQAIPCYCGCGDMGHTSNYSCYVQSNEGGSLVYDSHALGCSICVDITQDAARLWSEGKTLQEIKVEIDNTYSRYGPSNMD